jgi:hypothetical protein
MRVGQYAVFPRSRWARCTVLLTPLSVRSVQCHAARQLHMHWRTGTARQAAPRQRGSRWTRTQRYVSEWRSYVSEGCNMPPRPSKRRLPAPLRPDQRAAIGQRARLQLSAERPRQHRCSGGSHVERGQQTYPRCPRSTTTTLASRRTGSARLPRRARAAMPGSTPLPVPSGARPAAAQAGRRLRLTGTPCRSARVSSLLSGSLSRDHCLASPRAKIEAT